ncbi:MAG: GWxTD domain-containing protein [Balneolaceae bacterium]|nr:GWxTD domain-containing protein [Balneolaceae bacterium]
MAYSNKIVSFLFIIAILLSSLSPATAQRRITYEQLARQQRAQSIFFDYFTLPSDQDGTVQFVTTFRVDYNLLPFKKVDNPAPEKQFFSTIGMSIEIFRDTNPQPREADRRRNRRDREELSVKGLEPVARAMWKDTVFAENYAQTQSKNLFANGKLTTELKPGAYRYILQLTRGQEVGGQNSRTRFVNILPYRVKKQGTVTLIDSERNTMPKTGIPDKIKLLNFGNNVYYGKDFSAFVHLAGHTEGDRYEVKVNRVEVTERDTTRQSTVFSEALAENRITEGVHPSVRSENGSLYLSFSKRAGSPAYALIHIPNSRYQNAVYQLQVLRNGQEAPVAQTIFRSRWIEMPSSLLNVNIAIDMLRYIVDESTLKRLKSGSNAEKEKKFRAFWEERDPTPNTEFNELMAEYYRRIDYAYEQFSTINVSGYNTDQGRIYIQYGPPNSIERKFPPGEPAVEIWNYGKRQFIFRAVSGFGQFELVSK